MIVGLGVDVVDVARFERAITRTPGLRTRLFADEELVVDGRERAPRSLAARWAAKEAAAKALGAHAGMRWREIVVTQRPDGEPTIELRGGTAAALGPRGVARLHVSLSHDAGVAVATVVAES